MFTNSGSAQSCPMNRFVMYFLLGLWLAGETMRPAIGPVLVGTSSHQPSTSPNSHRAQDLRQELDIPLDPVLSR